MGRERGLRVSVRTDLSRAGHVCVCVRVLVHPCECESHCVRRRRCRLRGARWMGAARGGEAVGAPVGVQAGRVGGLIAL